MLDIVLTIVIVVLTLALIGVGIIARRFIKHVLVLEEELQNVYENVEESLDVLDESYGTITKIAGYEVISDEPFVRRVIDSINDARLAVGKVALKLATVIKVDEDDQSSTS